jgi:hypothetical protein
VSMLDWLELKDVEQRRWGNRTWILLRMSRVHGLEMTFGIEGYRGRNRPATGSLIFLACNGRKQVNKV